jgi:aspartate-semialdehyde dehydrogenase
VPAPGPVFASRIAFNSIALAGASLADGRSEQELAVENDVRALLGRPDLTLAYTAVWVPVFYGDGLAVNFTTVDGIETQALETVLAQTAAVAPAHTAAVPTPAAEGADQDFVHWGRLRATGQTGQEHALWLVADHVRSSAVNSVKLVEILVRDHF